MCKIAVITGNGIGKKVVLEGIRGLEATRKIVFFSFAYLNIKGKMLNRD